MPHPHLEASVQTPLHSVSGMRIISLPSSTRQHDCQRDRREGTHTLNPLSPSFGAMSLISTLLTFAGPGPIPRCCLNLSSELWSPCASPVTVPSLLFLTKPVMLSLLAWSVVQELCECQTEPLRMRAMWTDRKLTPWTTPSTLKDTRLDILTAAVDRCRIQCSFASSLVDSTARKWRI